MDLDSDIDSLLQRYLSLLDEYTNLRQQLSTLQKSMYQDIARANFSAERGLRFGQDHYDDRMQALRQVGISNKEKPVFSISTVPQNTKTDAPSPEKGEKSPEEAQDDNDSDIKEKQTEKVVNRDPLKWFGFVTPSALRNAQSSSVQAIETIIPRLASVNAEMMDVEIEVRRARKKRSKAQAAAVAA